MTTMPTWDEFMVPMLGLLADGQIRPLREIRDRLMDSTLTDDQRAAVLPSGQPKADNRIGWAASYLTRVGAVDRPMRGHYRISETGRSCCVTTRAASPSASSATTPSPTTPGGSARAPGPPVRPRLFLPRGTRPSTRPRRSRRASPGSTRRSPLTCSSASTGTNQRSSSRPSSTCSSPWATTAPRGGPPAPGSSATAASTGSSTRTPSG